MTTKKEVVYVEVVRHVIQEEPPKKGFIERFFDSSRERDRVDAEEKAWGVGSNDYNSGGNKC